MKICDIIIPIYNAYSYVEKCIESVIENTEFTTNKLILIDDQSSDERIWKLLKKFKSLYSFIDIYQNNENIGFVATVNRGMKISKNDVVLLNSDTEVTDRWLEKIVSCAYSKKNVATVTPLSNNATLASVPKTFEPNDIPDGLTLQEMADLVEKCSKKIYPEIPTGHGFCLFIKREILNRIGYFDEVTYGKGYGEENDFCFRCLDHGWRHLLCDDTFIFHKESQSFSDSKIALQKSASKKLSERYPRYCAKLDLWCQQKPLKYIADNVLLELEKRKKRNNILYIIHDWNFQNLGGTTLHVWDLINGMRKYYNFHVLTIEKQVYKLYSYWENSETSLEFYNVCNFNDFCYYNENWKEMLKNIIESFDIHFIHIHHMINHYFDIIDVIKEYKLKSILSVHDYYSVCPLIIKLYQNKHYCGEYDLKQCNSCLRCMFNYDYNVIEDWHRNWEQLFNVCTRIICPSKNCKNEIQKTYKKVKFEVIEHGIELNHIKSTLTVQNNKIIDVAFVGAIGYHKGSKILNELITKYKNRKIRIHLFGILDQPVPKNNKYFYNHGIYKRENLQNLLRKYKIKLVCLFSICPETFSYTLSECIAAGIPVLGFNIGAINDRVLQDNLGWIIDKNTSTSNIVKKIIDIKNNPEEYNQKIKAINNYKIKTVFEMCQDYLKIYNQIFDNMCTNNLNVNAIVDGIKESNKKNYAPVTYSNYGWILDTLKWKIVSKIKLPRFLKNMYHKVIRK